ncbi:RNase A-like domain-containing protein [Streptomyces sp. NBC_00649]|uniref:RNase A-like domain-containing protein n=1 Tax=Streptomyces sp. NBC_00649 TaxID=2975798 RepID=UPI00386840BC
MDRHVEKTDCELRARLRSDKQIGGGSSFLNELAAQDLTDRAMIREQTKAKRWLEKTPRRSWSSTSATVRRPPAVACPATTSSGAQARKCAQGLRPSPRAAISTKPRASSA